MDSRASKGVLAQQSSTYELQVRNFVVFSCFIESESLVVQSLFSVPPKSVNTYNSVETSMSAIVSQRGRWLVVLLRSHGPLPGTKSARKQYQKPRFFVYVAMRSYKRSYVLCQRAQMRVRGPTRSGRADLGRQRRMYVNGALNIRRLGWYDQIWRCSSSPLQRFLPAKLSTRYHDYSCTSIALHYCSPLGSSLPHRAHRSDALFAAPEITPS